MAAEVDQDLVVRSDAIVQPRRERRLDTGIGRLLIEEHLDVAGRETHDLGDMLHVLDVEIDAGEIVVGERVLADADQQGLRAGEGGSRAAESEGGRRNDRRHKLGFQRSDSP
jgi:hypothetical protein